MFIYICVCTGKKVKKISKIFEKYIELASTHKLISAHILPMSFDSSIIRSFLQHNLSGTALGGTFVFRRVKSVNFAQKVVPVYSKYTLPDEEPEVVSRASLSREELDKSVRITCSSFRGLTDARSMREEPDTIYEKVVSFSSDAYHIFDVAGLTFELIKSEPVTPIAGDLLCAFFSSTSPSHNMRIPVADAWFIASDQHLRALTAIMYDRHDSLTSIVAKNTPREEYNQKLKEKLFCGNRLMTNSWLKMKLAHEQNGVVFPREQSIKAYWHLRTDNASKYWVDVWAALVLIGRYGELPSDDNVPNTKGGDCSYLRKKWHLPEGFVERLFEISGCSIDQDNVYDSEDENPEEADNTTRCWPDDPEVVKEWLQSEKERREALPLKMPELESVPEPTKPAKRSVLEIVFTINWNEAEEGEENYI